MLEYFELLNLLINVLILIFLFLNNKNNSEINIKELFGLYIITIDEYNKYFDTYHLGKITRIAGNELSKDDYNKLIDDYVKKYFELYGDSKVTEFIIEYKYGSKEAFIKSLINNFDLHLFEQEISLKKQRYDDVKKTSYYV